MLIGIGLILYILVVIFRRELGVYLIILLLPTYQIRFAIGGIPMTFLEAMILLLFFITALGLVLDPRQGKRVWQSGIFKPSPRNLLIGLFLLAAFVSIFVSPQTLKAAGIFKAFFFEAILFYFLILILIDTRQKLGRLWQSMALLIIYLSGFALFQFLTLQNLPFSWWAVNVASRRVTSLVNHPNALALLLGPTLAMVIMLFLSSKTFSRNKLFVIATALGLAAMFLTFSRAGWLALLASLAITSLFSAKRKQILVGLGVIVILVLLIPLPRQKIFELFSYKDPSQQNRILLWTAAIDILKKSPIYGTGLAGFRETYKNYPLGPDRVIQNYPHNFFFNFWTETGLIGLISILGLLGFFFKKIYQLLSSPWRALALASAAGMAVIFLHGLVDVPYFKNDLSVVFWLIYSLPNLLVLNTNPEA